MKCIKYKRLSISAGLVRHSVEVKCPAVRLFLTVDTGKVAVQ